MRILILTTTLLLSLSSWSQVLTLSLADAQAKALEMNRNSQISQLEIEKAERKVKETLATGLPQIEADGSFQHFLDIPTQVLPDFISPTVYNVLINENLLPEGSGGSPSFIPAQFGTSYTMSGGAKLNQLIFSGSYLIGLKAAKRYVELSEIQKVKSDVDVRMDVADAYHTVLLAEENEKVLRESMGTLSESLIEVQALYDEGFVEEQDVQQIQLTLNTIKSQVDNSVRQFAVTKQLLNFTIGLPLDTELILSDDIESLSTSPEVEAVIAQETPDLTRHPDLLLADQSVILQGLQLKEQKSRYLPQINGFFQYQQQAQRNEFNFFKGGQPWYPSTVWGINLSLPIFSSGMKHQQVKQLEIELKEAELQQELAVDGLALNAEQTRSEYLFARENYDTEAENLELARSIRDKTRIKYQEGISSSFEQHEMESQFLEAQGRRIQATMNLLSALNNLKKAFNIL